MTTTESGLIKPEDFNPSLIFNQHFRMGTIDLVQGGAFQEIISRIIVGSYFVRRTDNNERAFSGVLVILPPANATTLTSSEIFKSLFDSAAAMTGKVIASQGQEFFRETVKILISPSLQSTDLLELMSVADRGTMIVVSNVELYRFTDIILPPRFGLTATRTKEDEWVPHVTALCKSSVKAAKDIEGHVLLHVFDDAAKSVINQNTLNGVDDCYVTVVVDTNSPDKILVENADRWARMAVGGKLVQVIDEINELPVSALNKKHLTVQLFHRAKNNQELLKLLSEIASQHDELGSTQRVQLAKIASDIERADLADIFLSSGLEDLVSETWLDTALDITTNNRNNQIIDFLDGKLSSLFPKSDALRDNRDKRLILNYHLFGKDNFRFTTAGFSEYHLFLSEIIAEPNIDYSKIFDKIQNWERSWRELALVCCAILAERDNDFVGAITCASTAADSQLYCRQASQIILRLVRRLLLTETINQDQYDFYVIPLEKVIRYLAIFPNDSDIRSQLISIFSVEVSGSAGMPLIIKLTLDQLSTGVRLEKTKVEEDSPVPLFDQAETHKFIEAGLIWLSEQAVVEPGVTVLPAEMVHRNPDSVIIQLKNLIQMTGSIQGEDVDLHYMEQLVLLTCAITPFAQSERNTDIQVLRHYACQLVISGQAQHARDLCEQVLLMSKGSSHRKRLAWIMIADVYQRNHQSTIAFLSLACASTIDIEMHPTELCEEVYIALRLMRDFGGLGALAGKTTQKLKELLELAGIDSKNDPRLVISEWTFKLRELHRIEPETLVRFSSEIALKCQENLDDRNFLLSGAVVLAQVIKRCDEISIPVDMTTRNVLTTAINRIGIGGAQFLSVLSASKPLPTVVVDLYNRIQHARYASDVPGDLRNITSVARSLLNGDLSSSPAEMIALAIELLAEQAIEYPVEPPNLVHSWPLAFSRTLSKQNIDIVFLALNSLNELVILYVGKDDVQLIEQPVSESSFLKRMQMWSLQYPKEYGYIDIDAGSNDFFTSMEKLEITFPITQNRVLVIAEPVLHSLPLNLLLTTPRHGGLSSFLGIDAAIGLAPSLTWLSLIQHQARPTSNRRSVWIPTTEEDGQQGALKILLSRIQETLDDFKFTLDTGPEIPRNFSESSIAVIAAHGGLTIDGKFIHTIRDEDALIENPSSLARALKNVELVILFVCSGGRLDKHPSDHTTVGLPKLLLNKGCRTIIASPWPLDVKVTYNWLSPFMEAWDAGESALDATQIANKIVAQKLGNHPAYSLAMTVYGDLLLTKKD